MTERDPATAVYPAYPEPRPHARAGQLPLSRRPVPLVRVLPELAFHLNAWVVMHEDLRAARRVRLVFEHLVAQLGAYATQAHETRPVAAEARPPSTRGRPSRPER